MSNAKPRILIFARKPEPGRVKTRLIPALGAEGACALHRRMLRHALRTAARNAGYPVELHCTPDTGDPFLRAVAAEYGAVLAAQRGHDLGERMANAARPALREGGPVLLLGTDAPVLTGMHIGRVFDALAAGAVAVMIPADDGGYVALGLGRYLPGVFEDISWGTEAVAGQTRRALRRAGESWEELPVLWDVDRPDDLQRLGGLPGWSGFGQ